MYKYMRLQLKLSSNTRWFSINYTLKRYIALRDHVAQLKAADVGKVLLPTSYERRVEALAKSLEHLNDVALQLQLHLCKMRQMRAYLNSVLKFYLIVEVQLM